MKAFVVEGFNRTLKNDMWKQFTHNGNYKWIDLLSHFVSQYNARKYRTVGMRSINVTPIIADKLLNTIYSTVKAALLIQNMWFGTCDQRRSLRKVTRQIGLRKCLESLEYWKLISWCIFWKITGKLVTGRFTSMNYIASLIPTYI